SKKHTMSIAHQLLTPTEPTRCVETNKSGTLLSNLIIRGLFQIEKITEQHKSITGSTLTREYYATKYCPAIEYLYTDSDIDSLLSEKNPKTYLTLLKFATESTIGGNRARTLKKIDDLISIQITKEKNTSEKEVI
ncbi:MAG: hypothetical protein V7731_18025, partial [Amphritea sp.]